MEAIIATSMADKGGQNISLAFKKYGRRLFAFVRAKVASKEDAEDLLQDVWYRLSQVSDPDELESISAWLYRVAKNRITDFYRKKKTESIEEFSYESDDGEINFKELMLASESDSPELKQFKNIFWDQLMQALEELPAVQREVFILNEMEEMTLQEIADKSGQNLKTIISRKGYAVKYLRERLITLYNEFINT